MSTQQVRAELLAAWDDFTAHNRDFAARTPMGEPAYTQWREAAILKAARLKRALAAAQAAGLRVFQGGPKGIEILGE